MPFIFITNYVEYYMHLDNNKVVNTLRYKYKDKPIVYAFKCLVTRKIYIGSTLTPYDRFHQHLVSGNKSNVEFQADINKYGLNKFVAYILEIVDIPTDISFEQKTGILRKAEQEHINKYARKQLYNSIKSSK